MNSLYQDVVNHLQQLTHNYSTTPHLHYQHNPTNEWNPFLHNISFSSQSTPPTPLLSFIPTPLYHDYTLNSKKTPHTTPNITSILNLQKSTITPSSPSSNPEHQWRNNIEKKNHIDPSSINKTTPTYTSHSSRDDNSFLCSVTERHNNLLFGHLIINPKKQQTFTNPLLKCK